jgi:hypothetical protein
MNLKFLLFSSFLLIADGFMFKFNPDYIPFLNNNKKPFNNFLLNSYGGNGNNIIYSSGGGGGNNDDNNDINIFISLILLNFFMIEKTLKNNYLYDLIFYNLKN